ncbi:MAG TPA: DUF1800 family protein [Acidimicrobiales bacterium]|nr:DUF1800 family protein [Acidimicrobiales bacterium]
MATTESERVAHVWRRLGFGPAPGDVAAGVAAGGAAAVVEDLLARPATDAAAWQWPAEQGNKDDSRRLTTRMFELWATGPSAVQERVSWMLCGLLVTGLNGSVLYRDMKEHQSRLRAWPATGSYKALLQEVANTAAMQKYLNGTFSAPPHANENLAREVLELFSLGVTSPRTGARNYTETDVKEIARALTGYRMDYTTKSVFFDPAKWDRGTKAFLGGDRGAAKLPEVIDAIARHDSFKYFVPRRIYRELLGFDPSARALDEMAAVWGPSGDLSQLISHVARRPEFLAAATIANRVKSPVELLVSALRVLGKKDLSAASMAYLSGILRQHPLVPPDVSGWENSWLHPGHVVMWSHVSYWLCWSDKGPAKDGTADATPVNQRNPFVRKLFADATRATAADMALQLAGLHAVSPDTRSAIDAFARSAAWTGEPWTYERACAVMQLVFNSPEFLVG